MTKSYIETICKLNSIGVHKRNTDGSCVFFLDGQCIILDETDAKKLVSLMSEVVNGIKNDKQRLGSAEWIGEPQRLTLEILYPIVKET